MPAAVSPECRRGSHDARRRGLWPAPGREALPAEPLRRLRGSLAPAPSVLRAQPRLVPLDRAGQGDGGEAGRWVDLDFTLPCGWDIRRVCLCFF